MIVKKYPADFGHTTVINNLCLELKNQGYDAVIGAFSFSSPPPNDIKPIKLNKFELFFKGVNSLNYDIINFHQTFPIYFLLTKKTNKPIVLYYHGASNLLQKINFKIAMKLYKNRISKIISVSKSGIEQMKQLIGDISAEVIYNGVDTEFYNPDLPIPYKKGEPQLLFVSGLRTYKKTSVLIQSMPKLLQKYPNAHLQIVGEGKDFENLKNIIKEKNLENSVELTGKISNEELKLRYSSCDVYVSASTFEVCPVPTLEAMACGKPLVLSDIPPHREIIEISKAGKIFSSTQNSDFIDAVENVFQNKEIYKKLSLTFAKEHDWKEITKQVIKNFENT